MLSVLAILGSARHDGDTARVLDAVLAGRHVTHVDLTSRDIRHYEYDRSMEGDDFAALASAMVVHDAVILATPVYWYAMSGRMKVLFDRFTDLVTVRKELGRGLRGRSMFVVACGSSPTLPDGFEVPFRDTANYLHMHYGGIFYAAVTKNGELSAELCRAAAAFGAAIFDAVGDVQPSRSGNHPESEV